MHVCAFAYLCACFHASGNQYQQMHLSLFSLTYCAYVHTHNTHTHVHTHREFELAEIEYFVHPHKKEKFPKFKNVADTAPYLYPRDAQFSGEPPKRMRLGEAVEKVECCRCQRGAY